MDRCKRRRSIFLFENQTKTVVPKNPMHLSWTSWILPKKFYDFLRFHSRVKSIFFLRRKRDPSVTCSTTAEFDWPDCTDTQIGAIGTDSLICTNSLVVCAKKYIFAFLKRIGNIFLLTVSATKNLGGNYSKYWKKKCASYNTVHQYRTT